MNSFAQRTHDHLRHAHHARCDARSRCSQSALAIGARNQRSHSVA